MRIAIDARELIGGRPASGGTCRPLLTGMEPAARGRRTRVRPLRAGTVPTCAAGRLTTCPSSTAPGHGRSWQQVTLPRLVNAATRTCCSLPAYSGPLLSQRPMVVSVHDVSFSAHPEWFGWREGLAATA